MNSQASGIRHNHTKVVLLDRDGVINRKAEEGSYIHNRVELELLPGVTKAVRLLNQAGILAIVVTNQRGIALGLFSEQDLDAIHDLLQAELAEASAHLDAIYHCPHEYGECNCRKPQTGMLEQAFRDFPVANRENTVLIGDSANDITAGKAFGIPTILITAGHTEHERVRAAGIQADANATSLLDAIERIILPEANVFSSP